MKKRRRWPRLTLKTTPQVIETLDTLLRTGLFGFTLEDVAERLLCRELLREDVAYFWRPGQRRG